MEQPYQPARRLSRGDGDGAAIRQSEKDLVVGTAYPTVVGLLRAHIPVIPDLPDRS
jgi:hypothetical protein